MKACPQPATHHVPSLELMVCIHSVATGAHAVWPKREICSVQKQIHLFNDCLGFSLQSTFSFTGHLDPTSRSLTLVLRANPAKGAAGASELGGHEVEF